MPSCRSLWRSRPSVCADDPVGDSTTTQSSEETAAEAGAPNETGTGESTPTEEAEPAPAEPPPPPPPPPLATELRPYRVLVSVGFSAQPEFDNRFRAFTLKRLREQIDGQIGAMWQADIEMSPQLGAAGGAVLQEKSILLSGVYSASEYDKVFWLTVERVGSRYEIAGIEWDGAIRQPGPVLTQETRDSRRIDETMMAVMLEAFRPVALIEDVGDDTVVLIARAGELLPISESATQFRPGDYLAMSFRYLDRQRVVQRIQDIPWTFVRIDTIDRARLEATVISAFRQPIPQARRRVEIAGLVLKVVHPETTLVINARGTPPEPLIASPVDVMDRFPTEEDAVEDRIRLVTDRFGSVAVPAFPESPLRFLMIHSGDQVLAKVPMIPGVSEQLQLEVPNDSPRLEVEGELSLLQGHLIDVVARGAVLMARASLSAKAGRWDEVDGFTRELDQLPELDDIQGQINTYQNIGVNEAQQLRDRVQEARIRRMCRELSELATRHLAPDRRQQFNEQMRELRTLSDMMN